MPVVKNNTKSDKHLALFKIVNQETGEGESLAYIVPHTRFDKEDQSKVIVSGKVFIADDDLAKLKENRAINAFFENGELVVVRDEGGAPKAETIKTEYDGSISKGVEAAKNAAAVTLVVPGKK